MTPEEFYRFVSGFGRDVLIEMLRQSLADHMQANDNLTAVQVRCNELLEENRQLKRRLAAGVAEGVGRGVPAMKTIDVDKLVDLLKESQSHLLASYQGEYDTLKSLKLEAQIDVLDILIRAIKESS